MARHKIKANKAQCLQCGDIVESIHPHSYESCSCGNVTVSGGRSRIGMRRRINNVESYKDLTEFEDDVIGKRKRGK